MASAEEATFAIDPEELANQVYTASKAAFTDLIKTHSDQSFYAFALFTDDSLQFLYPAANTEEGLRRTVQRYRETVDPKYGCTSTRTGMRWSYGDWEFFSSPDYGHFNDINESLRSNFDRMIAEEEFDGGLEYLWDAILNGFRRLESENFFGRKPGRSKITLMLVGHVPWERVTSWVAALNPPDVVEQFVNWDCDAPDDGE